MLAVAGACLPSAAAHASAPCRCEVDVWSAPPNKAEGIPTNSQFFVSGIDPQSVEITQGGVTVDIDITTVGKDLLLIVPKADLMANATHVLHGTSPNDEEEITWVTGAAPDDQDPELKSSLIKGASLSTCAEHLGAEVRVVELDDDIADPEAMIVRVDIESKVFGPVYLYTEYPLRMGRMLEKGWDDCVNNAAGAHEGERYTATVTAIDWAGNTSPPSNASEFAFARGSAAGNCLCSWDAAASAPAHGAAAALALAATATLRRARRRARRHADLR